MSLGGVYKPTEGKGIHYLSLTVTVLMKLGPHHPSDSFHLALFSLDRRSYSPISHDSTILVADQELIMYWTQDLFLEVGQSWYPIHFRHEKLLSGGVFKPLDGKGIHYLSLTVTLMKKLGPHDP